MVRYRFYPFFLVSGLASLLIGCSSPLDGWILSEEVTLSATHSNDFNLSESSSESIVFSLSSSHETETLVQWEIKSLDGSQPDQRFNTTSGSFSIAEGETEYQFPVDLINDRIKQSKERFYLELTSPTEQVSIEATSVVLALNDTDKAPQLDDISNRLVQVGQAMSPVDVNDKTSASDTDEEGDALLYSCYYDQVLDSQVANTTPCTDLNGYSFNTTSGVSQWTPTSLQTGSYEVKVVATDNYNEDSVLFSITVNNSAPDLSPISDQTVNEGQALATVDAQDLNTSDDTDVDGDAISYTCYYDNTDDNTVADTNACTTLTGVSFTSSTGMIDWTPDYDQAGTYEFKITGSDGSLTDDTFFTVTVANVNRAPALSTISDQSVNEGQALTTVNAQDSNTSGDTDIDGDAISYTCYYDNTDDNTVADTNGCGTLTGVSFTSGTGVIDWTPDYDQAGTFEFKITGSDGSLTDETFFTVNVAHVNQPPVLAAISDEGVYEGQAIASVNANDNNTGADTDSDGDTISYTCYYDNSNDDTVADTNACSTLTGVSFTSSTGALDWTPDYDQEGTYEFKITGSDGSLTDQVFFTIAVYNTNRAPALSTISDQAINENQALTTVNAQDSNTSNDTDIDGDTISYTCYYDSTDDNTVADTNACTTLTGISFTSSTGVIDWTPDYNQAGTYEFKITGSDGSLTDDTFFTVTVANVNRAPALSIITDQSINEGQALTTVNAQDSNTSGDTDIDGDAISYTCYYDTTDDNTVADTNACTTLTGISFTSSTGVIDWTPNYDQAGTFEFKITGSDGSLTDQTFFTVVVSNVNRAPALSSILNQTVYENQAITTVDAYDTNSSGDTDIDGDTISYTCYYDTISDDAVADTNACTTLTGVSFTSSTGVIDWTPNYDQAGTYEFKITGSDGSLTDATFFTVDVTNVNRAPALATISDQSVNENQAITTVDAYDTNSSADTDIDGDAISYTCYYDNTDDNTVSNTNGCGTLTGVSFTSSTGVIDWTPNYDQAGTYEFKITGSDGSLTDDTFFTVIVANVNRAPALSTIADQAINENQALTTVNAQDSNTSGDTDIDGDAISYTCYYDNTDDNTVSNTNGCGTLTGVSFTSATGVVDWTPNYDQSGTYEFKITGSDGSLTDATFFTVTVANVNRAPALSTITDQSINENQALTTVNAQDSNTSGDTDIDGDAISYTCYYDNTDDNTVSNTNGCGTLTGVSFTSGTGVVDWTPNYDQSGTYEFKITGSDGSLTDAVFFTVTVANVNRAPALSAITDQSISENQALTTVNAQDSNTSGDTDIDGDAISYTCYYDTTDDNTVADTNTCSTLSGVSFTSGTGVIDWTPGYDQAGTYEFKVTGSDGSLTDATFFTVTVANTLLAGPVVSGATSTEDRTPTFTWSSGGTFGSGQYRFKVDDSNLTTGATTTTATSHTTGVLDAGSHTFYIQELDNYGDWSQTTSFSFTITCPTGWYNCNWPYRIKITVNTSQVPATQSDFPVYVNLADLGTDFFTNVLASGADILVTDSANTALWRELDSFDKAGSSGALWFRASSISDSDVFYIYYGNDAGAETNAIETWNGYLSVWHNSQDPTASSILDSVGSNDGTAYNMISGASVTGRFGKALDFDNNDDYVQVDSGSGALNIYGTGTAIHMTICSWVRPNGYPGSLVYKTIISKGDTQYGSKLNQNNKFEGKAEGLYFYGDNYITDAPTWYHTCVVADGSKVYLYVDGVKQANNIDVTSITSTTDPVWMGRDSENTGRSAWDGLIDEVHFSGVARTANWIKTEYNNQSNPTTFFAIGSQVTY